MLQNAVINPSSSMSMKTNLAHDLGTESADEFSTPANEVRIDRRPESGILSASSNGKTLKEILCERGYQAAYFQADSRIQRVLTLCPHIRSASQKNRLLKEALVFHQLLAGDTTRKFNQNRQADHDLRVTEAVLEYSWTHFGFYPQTETIITSVFHDSMEDYKAKGWVITELFGANIEASVRILTLPEKIRKTADKRLKADLKHAFKMNSVNCFTSGHCIIKHFDGIDVLAAFIRNVLKGNIIAADIDDSIEIPGVPPVLPLAKFKNELSRRYEFSLALQRRLELANSCHWLNLDGFVCLKMVRDFRTQFAQIGEVFAEVFGIPVPPGLQEDIERLKGRTPERIGKTKNGIRFSASYHLFPSL